MCYPHLPIIGMTCASCANRIERTLTTTPGVRRAAVNLSTSRATVEYDPQHLGVRHLIETVASTVYGTIGIARADFVVDDSARPAASSQPLEQHLVRLAGTARASFNLATLDVRAEYLPGATDPRAIRRRTTAPARPTRRVSSCTARRGSACIRR